MDSGDYIQSLKDDDSMPTHNELKIINTLFKEEQPLIEKIYSNLSDTILVGVLVGVFSMPFVDDIITKMCPGMVKSPPIKLGIKIVVAMLVYFILKNFQLSKKQD